MPATARRLAVPAVSVALAAAILAPHSVLAEFGGSALGELRRAAGPAAASFEPPAAGQVFATQSTTAGEDEALYEKVYRAVVTIEAWEDGVRKGNGSGFLIDPEGIVLTNSHVVTVPAGYPRRDKVKFYAVRYGPSGRGDRRFKALETLEAKVLGKDDERDFALLKIDVDGPAPYLELQREVRVGETVWSIGAPLGFESSFGRGIVSGIGRSRDELAIPSIQTTASLSPGNSGGPLVNALGQAVGINAWVAGRGFGTSLGFALPIGRLARHIVALRKTGETALGSVGADFEGAAPGAPSGAQRVAAVIPGGAAERAGLKVGDVVTRVAGRAVTDQAAVLEAVADTPPGEVLAFEVLRGAERLTIEVPVDDGRAVQAAEPHVPPHGDPHGDDPHHPEGE